MANVVPAAAKSASAVFKNDNAFYRWARYVSWNYLWDGRKFGLQFMDQYYEPAPEVTEALRRLNMQEPWVFDQRKMRLTRAHTLSMKNEMLPKAQWTKWEDETWYLKKYLDEIENEKVQRSLTSDFTPSFSVKDGTTEAPH
uniref:Cytochrome b-c1 complex subunit 7 n=1 Tax=Plectus sambesii TaxID=2011161 RepID=A0A914WJ51_9BILA